jgi:excisionase family DNA binding protein
MPKVTPIDTTHEPGVRVAGREDLSTREAAQIIGVSLSTVQKMVEAGTLQAWKTRGGHRRIPLEAAKALAREKSATHRSLNASAVLIVEDNPTMVALYQKIFNRRTPTPVFTVAADAAEALVLIERTRPSLIITDLLMEPFDGFHLLRVLQRSPEFARIRVLVVSALSASAIAEKGGLPPSVVVYRKPLVGERLEGYLDAVFQEDSLRRPGLP